MKFQFFFDWVLPTLNLDLDLDLGLTIVFETASSKTLLIWQYFPFFIIDVSLC